TRWSAGPLLRRREWRRKGTSASLFRAWRAKTLLSFFLSGRPLHAAHAAWAHFSSFWRKPGFERTRLLLAAEKPLFAEGTSFQPIITAAKSMRGFIPGCA